MSVPARCIVRSALTCLAACALSAAAAPAALAAELHVPSQYATIQAAIDAASNGDEVIVADGTYQGSGFENIDFAGKAITVRSANGPENCILSYEGGARAFHFHSGEGGDSIVSGFTIEYGYAWQSDGGAILCEDSGPTINDCVFVGNGAGQNGGAIANFDGDITVRGCVFSGNDAQNSGGAIFLSGGSPIIASCGFSGNDAAGGGAVYNFYTAVLIDECRFEANTSLDPGGAVTNYNSESRLLSCGFKNNVGAAIYTFGGLVAINTCEFSGNTGFWGGAMFSRQGASITVEDCAFDGNSAEYGGAAFTTGPYSDTPTSVQMTRCSFTGNSADDAGGATYNWLYAVVTLRQCQFFGNEAGDEGGGAVFIGIASDVNVGNCFFGDNSARIGGAICNQGEEDPPLTFNPIIVNCVFTANAATYGGGIYNDLIDPAIVNCSFTANSATRGTGVYYTTGTGGRIANSILWANASNVSPIWGGSPTVAYSNVQGGYPGTGNINADPLFTDADGPDNVPGTADDNLRLQSGSPSINTGSNSLIPPDVVDVDLDGNTTELTPLDLDLNKRIVNITVDMGAYERQ